MPVARPSVLDRAREAYARRAWQEAFELLTRADAAAALGSDDLWRLSLAAELTGRMEILFATLERAHRAHADAGQCAQAARTAFWLGFRLMSVGEHARGGGWLGRAQRLVDRECGDCVEQGYLLLPQIMRQLGAGENAATRDLARRAAEIGERFADLDLVVLARTCEGKALLRLGEVAAGLSLLDEVLVTVTSSALSPQVPGIVYCDVIACCQQFYALPRAREWTAALAAFCDAQPELVSFTGACLVHRSEIMQLGGAWGEAIAEAQRAGERLSRATDPLLLAASHYQQAEILRLRGEREQAEAAYLRTSELGGEPQPGLSLLRVSQGRLDEALSSMRRVLDTTPVAWRRARFLPACVEIMLAAGELDAAQAACDELHALAASMQSEILGAISAHARGSILLARGSAQDAVEPLRHAFAVWQTAGAPFIAAQIRIQLGRACRLLGDSEGARLELSAARQVFERLGAGPALAAVEDAERALQTEPGSTPPREHGLTARELQVLRLLASGKSNKEIGRALFVSERTVGRHVDNIFGKLAVHSRAAATAFAYEHGLLS
jgi:DNA-binding NarL/FixJ family response regulator